MKLARQAEGLKLRARQRTYRRGVPTSPGPGMQLLGTHYGGYTLPVDALDASSACVLAGIGEDITFDMALIARYGCTVHALDPVPRSQEYARVAASHEPRFVLHPCGLWSQDTELVFHAAAVDGFVSHSATNLHGTDGAFHAPVRSVASLMAELGFDRLDLLKVSAEGSEYEIVDHVLSERIDVRLLCVEFAQPTPTARIDETRERLAEHGYRLLHADIAPWNWKFTFAAG